MPVLDLDSQYDDKGKVIGEEKPPESEPKPRGISRKQRAALRYLNSWLKVKDPIQKKTVMVKPTIRMVCNKYGIKESTLLDWLIQDPDFFNEYLGNIKADVIREMRELVDAMVKKVKESKDTKAFELLMKWIGAFDQNQGQQGEQSWEDMVS